MFNFGNQNNRNFNNENSNTNTYNQKVMSNSAIDENRNLNTKISNTNQILSFETLQKARRDLMGELEAIIEYDNHIHNTNMEVAKSTWVDIRNEELNHVGQLLALIVHLAPYQKELIESGVKEFNERLV